MLIKWRCTKPKSKTPAKKCGLRILWHTSFQVPKIKVKIYCTAWLYWCLFTSRSTCLLLLLTYCYCHKISKSNESFCAQTFASIGYHPTTIQPWPEFWNGIYPNLVQWHSSIWSESGNSHLTNSAYALIKDLHLSSLTRDSQQQCYRTQPSCSFDGLCVWQELNPSFQPVNLQDFPRAKSNFFL